MGENATVCGSEKKRAYLRSYYSEHREEIRTKQKATYEAKYTYASPELLEHLRANPTHASLQTACSECQRLGPVLPRVCLECGRFPLKQIGTHSRQAHNISPGKYRTTWRTSNRRRTSRQPRRPPPATRLSRRLQKLSVSDWDVASRRLSGVENKQIAADLHVSRAFVNKRCRELGLGSKPARYWRGEAVADRHLDALLRESRMSTKALASKLAIPVHRLSRALRRRGKPLTLDLALAVREELQRIKPSGPRALRVSERQEIEWKSRALRADLTKVRDALQPKSDLAATICRLQRSGRITVLFRWAREFVGWASEQYVGGLQPADLTRVADVANEFLANEYPVKADTLPHLVARRMADLGWDVRDRRAAADVLTVFGGESWMASSDLLKRLRGLGLAPWARMRSEKRLAATLRPLGLTPSNRRAGAQVLKGYHRADLKAWGSKEAALRLRVSAVTLKLYIRSATVPAPPLIRRRGVRGSGRIRVWTESDIAAARAALDSRPPKTRDRSRNPFAPRLN